jgi:hypothetical protein
MFEEDIPLRLFVRSLTIVLIVVIVLLRSWVFWMHDNRRRVWVLRMRQPIHTIVNITAIILSVLALVRSFNGIFSINMVGYVLLLIDLFHKRRWCFSFCEGSAHWRLAVARELLNWIYSRPKFEVSFTLKGLFQLLNRESAESLNWLVILSFLRIKIMQFIFCIHGTLVVWII